MPGKRSSALLALASFFSVLSPMTGCGLLGAGAEVEEQAPAPPPPPPPPMPDVDRYDVELRQRENTCGPLDDQVAYDTFQVMHVGERDAVIFAGTDRVFAVDAQKQPGGAVKLSGRIVEPESAKAGRRRVVCKRITEVELLEKDGRLEGTYTRRIKQECLAKGCSLRFDVDGRAN